MRIYWLSGVAKGNLGMMARPRGGEWLQDEVATLRKSGVDAVVSLLEHTEMRELQLVGEGQACRDLGISFLHFPISDRNVPVQEAGFRQLLDEMDQLLDQGKHVVVHCRMGIGRTGMVMAAMAIRRGGDPKTVFAEISRARTMAVPDTEAQKRWILDRDWRC